MSFTYNRYEISNNMTKLLFDDFYSLLHDISYF